MNRFQMSIEDEPFSQRTRRRRELLAQSLKERGFREEAGGYFFCTPRAKLFDILQAKNLGSTVCLDLDDGEYSVELAEKIALADKLLVASQPERLFPYHLHVSTFEGLIDYSLIPLRFPEEQWRDKVVYTEELPPGDAPEFYIASAQEFDLIICDRNDDPIRERLLLQTGTPLLGSRQLSELSLAEEYRWLMQISPENKARVKRDYVTLQRLFLKIREEARELWGQTTRKLLKDLSRSSADLSIDLDKDWEALSVVVLNEGFADQARKTLRSLQSIGLDNSHTTLVSALPCRDVEVQSLHDEFDDFFNLFQTLERVLREAKTKKIVLLRAGAELSSGFLDLVDADEPLLIQGYPDNEYCLDKTPLHRTELLLKPWLPAGLIFPKKMIGKERFSSAGPLSLWALSLQLSRTGKQHFVRQPFVRGSFTTPLGGYYQFQQAKDRRRFQELPPEEEEWPKLLPTLLTMVYEWEKRSLNKIAAHCLGAALKPAVAKIPHSRESIECERLLLRQAFEQQSKENYELRQLLEQKKLSTEREA